MFEAEVSPGAAEAGLDLIKDEQNAVPVADLAQVCEIALRRDDDAGLALNGLDEDSCREGRDRRLKRTSVAERHRDKARREWAKTAPVRGLGRKANERRGAAMEIVCRNNNFRLAIRD